MKSIIKIKKAAKNWEEGLPIGNGRLGATILGKISEEMITINEESVWYGPFRNRKNPDCIESVPKIRELLFSTTNSPHTKPRRPIKTNGKTQMREVGIFSPNRCSNCARWSGRHSRKRCASPAWCCWSC